MYKVGIIGFGTMGQGLAHWLVQKGHEVWIHTGHPEKVGLFVASIERYYSKRHSGGVIPAIELSEPTKQIHYAEHATDLREMDVIIESVKEDLEAKRRVLSHTSRGITGADTLLTSTTSSFSIAELAQGVENTSAFLGLHFFSPIPLMDLVEVIPGKDTHPTALSKAIQFCKTIGKLPMVVKDGRGFLVNRIFARYLIEASRMLESNAGSLHEIDLELSRNLLLHGPFYISDLIGLDVLLTTNKNLNEYYGGQQEDRFPVSLSLKVLCERGRLGRKTGRGYYCYTPRGILAEDTHDEELTEILNNIRHSAVIDRVPVSRHAALFSMVDEAILCLAEGVVTSVSDIDRAMQHGVNMLRGPIEIARQLGPLPLSRAIKNMTSRYRDLVDHGPLVKNLEAIL